MKKLLLLVIPALILTLAGCSKAESEDKEKDAKKNTQEQQKEQGQETNEQTSEQTSEQEENTDGLNHAKPIEEMTPEEYDTYLLTQKRAYLTKEQQERYDELLIMKGSSPGENDEKNQANNRKIRNEIEGNGGGTALIEPSREGETNGEHKKRQEKLVEQEKQRQAESDNNEQSQSVEQQQQQQAPTKQPTQQVPTERNTPEQPEQKHETIEK